MRQDELKKKCKEPESTHRQKAKVRQKHKTKKKIEIIRYRMNK